MYAHVTQLKPLSSIELTAEEKTILTWLKSAAWEPVPGAKEPIPYKAKVPEFYSGARLYRMQAGGVGALGALDLFIKKLAIQGVISKQDMYPVSGHGNQPRYLSLKKTDLNNLGVGKDEDDEDD